MEDSTSKVNYRFISESEYYDSLKTEIAQCLIRMKVFNGELQTDIDRTVFFEIDSIDTKKIEDCLSGIKKFHFGHAKSFHIDTNIINSKPE